jgi:cation transport regulator
MPYDAIAELPKGVKDNLPKHAQEIYLEAYNHAWEEYNHEEERARRVAWGAVKKSYEKDESSGEWKKIE